MNINSQCINNIELHKMKGMEIYFCRYNRMEFTEQEWKEYLDYHDELALSILPGDTVTPREIKRKWFSQENEEESEYQWMVLKKYDGKIIGRGVLRVYTEKSPLYAENRHTGSIFIDTHSEYRRKGIAEQMLKFIAGKAEECGIRILQSDYILKSSGRFCSRFGFDIASDRNFYRLYQRNIDWNKLKEYSNIKASEQGVTLKCFQFVPDDLLDEFCRVYSECGRMAPDYDGDFVAAEQITPESVRRDDEYCRKNGYVKLNMISIEKNGSISGVTDLGYDTADPKIVNQGLTGVLTDHRGRGIGLWLKSAILFRLKELNTDFEYIETGNNKSNTAMLVINEKLGYVRHSSHVLVTAKLKDIKEKLDNEEFK